MKRVLTAFLILVPACFLLVAYAPAVFPWQIRFDGKKVNYKKIQNACKNNKEAKEVFVTNGSIDYFPREMYDMYLFNTLILGNVQIGNTKQVNKDLCNCKSLIKLQLGNTNFTELNLWDSCKSIYLRHLVVVNTKLTELKIRPWNPTIKTISLFNTDLESLPEKFETMDHLEFLSISKNPKMDIHKELDKISTQKRLKTIGVAYNDLTAFPDQIFNLKTLEEIQIHGNDITAFDQRLTNLPNLKKINLQQNKTPFSAALKAEFAEKLPNCEIRY
jgi:Leucine-rich repeat (LRR) protein